MHVRKTNSALQNVFFFCFFFGFHLAHFIKEEKCLIIGITYGFVFTLKMLLSFFAIFLNYSSYKRNLTLLPRYTLPTACVHTSALLSSLHNYRPQMLFKVCNISSKLYHATRIFVFLYYNFIRKKLQFSSAIND